MVIKYKTLFVTFISFACAVLGNLYSYSATSLPEAWTRYHSLMILLILLGITINLRSLCFLSKEYSVFRLLIYITCISVVVNETGIFAHSLSGEAMFQIISLLLAALILPKLQTEDIQNAIIGIVASQILFAVYYGLSANAGWNTLANSSAASFISIIIILTNKYKAPKWIHYFVSFLAILVLVISGSRTALLAFLVSIAYYELKVMSSETNASVKRFILFGALIVAIFFLQDYISNFFVHKWSSNSTLRDQLFAGERFKMWSLELQNIKLLGKENNYFWSQYLHADTHNIFIQVLSRYGLVALLIFLTFSVRLMKDALCLRKSSYSTEATVFIIYYFITGLFENVLFLDMKMFTPCSLILLFYALLEKRKEEVYDDSYAIKTE